jgi:hypothetical protein
MSKLVAIMSMSLDGFVADTRDGGEAFEYALRSAEARDGLGQMWLRFPDTEMVLTRPRYPEILAAMGA